MSRKNKIGSGTFGSVIRRGDKAIKILKTGEDAILSSAWREITVVAGLNHPNVIKIEKVHLANGEIHIQMQLYECDLYGWIEQYEPTTRIMIDYYRQIAMGLQYIHASGIIHADIKPNNILIRGREAVITDFGIAVPGGNNNFRHKRVQTEYYRAPEVATRRYGYPIDCWSFGILIAEISFGKTKLPPAVHAEDIGLPNNILGRICTGLLDHSPQRRFTAARVATILSAASKKSHNNFVPAPIIQVPLAELPILRGENDDGDLDPDVMRFANRLYEASGCKKNLRRACYYLTACVYNFDFDYNLDAKTAGQIMPGLHFSQC